MAHQYLGRCDIFFYDGYINVSPSVITLSNSIHKSNYKVTIWAGKTSIGQLGSSLDSGITIKRLDRLVGWKLFKRISFHCKSKHIDELFLFVDWMYFSLQFFIRTIFQLIIKRDYPKSLAIGVDRSGSLPAMIYTWILRPETKWYLSLELIVASSTNPVSSVARLIDRAYFRLSDCVIIQDDTRLEKLEKELRYRARSICYFPNAPSEAISSELDSNYLQKKLGIKPDTYKFLVLAAGMIDDKVYSIDVAKTFSHLSDLCALIFHERECRRFEDPYIVKVTHANQQNLFLSLSPVEYNDLDSLFSSIDIGIAFYNPVDSNFEDMAKTSGKLAFYLKHGKPVLLNNLPSFHHLNNEYSIGVIVNDICDPLEMRKAIETISNNYSLYSANALSCYHCAYNPSRHLEPLLSTL